MPLLDRHFTIAGEATFDLVDWEIGPVEIVAADGTVVYSQPGTEFPVEWSKTARQIVASKYFYGQLGVDREFSLKQLIQRVVCTIADAGTAEGYFGVGEDEEEIETFEDELTAILLSQRASFNSPVWFNIGVEGEVPQASACYINSIEDDMGAILDLAKTEGIIFKRGSGAGVNLSPLRGENEKLRGGGIASGPVSFMKGYDAFAGAIKSGGKTRRAAKIIILDADHPDIMQFIKSKTKEEDKAFALIKAGYDSSIDGEAYGSVFFQNANHSVMVSDEFMELATGVFDDTPWYLINRGDGAGKAINPRKLFREMATAAWRCGDPGLMFRDAMNMGNTCKNSGQIVATNPCFAAGTLVHTKQGHFPIETLVGKATEIWDGNQWVVVDNFRVTGTDQPVLKIELYNGSYLFVTPQHTLVLENEEEIPASLLEVGDRLKIATAPTTYEGTKVSSAYLKGFLCGDGHVDHIKAGLRIYAPKFCCEQRLCDSAKEQNIQLSFYEDTDKFHTARGLTEALQSWVTTNRRTLPKEIFGWDGVSKAKFIAGAFDADGTGCDTANGWFYQISSIHKQWLEDFQLLLQTLGVRSHLSLMKPVGEVDFNDGYGSYPTKDCWRLTVAQESSITLSSQVAFSRLPDFSHKKTAYKVKPRWNRVKNISSVGLHKQVYCCTVPTTHRLSLSNGIETGQCGEYIWLNDTSCNLASINLMAFYDGENFNLSDFEQTVRVMITAMDILCGMAEYPTEKIAENTLKYRTLGLGFTNLGAVLMAYGMPYDSSRARNWAAQLTSEMTSEAYLQSAKIAAVMGPFPEYEKNAEEMHDVLQRQNIKATKYARENHGFRNAQVTVLAPTGTISFMMDADTTGIEPLLTLTPRKSLVGGGEIAVFPKCFEMGLKKLGYDPDRRQKLMDFVKENGQLFDEAQLPILADGDSDIFATAIGVNNTIPPAGHLKMLQACQKYLSGGISKTVNLPATSTVQDVERIYTQAWKLGLKNISIYRDGCKESQPVVGFKKVVTIIPTRKKLPPERPAITHKFNVAGHKGYLTVGLFDDGSPGEVFVTMAKEGSTISGVMGAFATMISLALQYGIPLRFLTAKFKDSRYEPSGYTGNVEIPYAKSLTDYIFQWMALRFPSGRIVQHTPTEEPAEEPIVVDSSAPFCSLCEEQMVSTGGQCYACKSCGETSGGCG